MMGESDASSSTYADNRNKFKEYLLQSNGHKCTICQDVYNLHEKDLAAFEGVDTCHIFSAMNVFYSGKIDNLQKAVNSVVPTAIVKLQMWYIINGWSISRKPCMNRRQMSLYHCQVGAIGLWVLFQIWAVKTHIKNVVFFHGILEC